MLLVKMMGGAFQFLCTVFPLGHESNKSAQSVLKALIPLMEELYRLDKQKRHVGVLQAVVSCFKVCIQSNSHLQETVRNGHTFLVLYEMAKEFSKGNVHIITYVRTVNETCPCMK